MKIPIIYNFIVSKQQICASYRLQAAWAQARLTGISAKLTRALANLHAIIALCCLIAMPMRLTPDEIVDGLRRGDQAVFEAFVRQYSNAIASVVASHIHNAEDAEEVLQDVLMQAYSKIGTLRPSINFWRWLKRIAINIARSRLRYDKRDCCNQHKTDSLPEPETEDEIVDAAPLPEAAMLLQESAADLKSAIMALPLLYREPLVMCDIKAMSPPEIGAALNLNVNTVKTRVRRARLLLRKRFQRP